GYFNLSNNYTKIRPVEIATYTNVPKSIAFNNEETVTPVYPNTVDATKASEVKIVNSTNNSKSNKNTTTKDNNKQNSGKKPVKIKISTKKANSNHIVKSTQKNSIIKEYNPYLYELWLKLLNDGNITNISYSEFVKLLKENGINVNAKTFDVEKIIEICNQNLEKSKNKTI
ncbi:MAG: hypothetical protein Q4Q22_09065, partial [Methanosphaera sp.]|nr:hypothetical protein [Methanosphaera sp.]